MKILSEQEIREKYASALSKMDLCIKLFGFANGATYQKLAKCAIEYDLDLSVLVQRYAASKVIHQRQTKQCPVCNKDFVTSDTGSKIKTTCSYACSNTHFRSGSNHHLATKPSANRSYRTICFSHHTKECIICQENLIVEVHHYDGNNRNDAPENLIPLCPNHHQYWHSRHRYLIEERVRTYRKQYMLTNNIEGDLDLTPPEAGSSDKNPD